MRKALAIAGVNLRRLVRDRTAAFFMFVFPLFIILAIGAVFGAGFEPKLGLVSEGSGPLGADLARRLEAIDGIGVKAFDDMKALRTAVERGEVEGGLVIPAGYDRSVREGETVRLPFLARPVGAGAELRQTVVTAALDEQAILLRAARFAESEGAGTFDQGLARARTVMSTLPAVTVRVTAAGEESETFGTFDYGAAQELVLFMFVTSLTASTQLIETRRLGVSRRMLASPTPARTLIGGETLGRFVVALVQGLFIVVVTMLAFRVDWGNLPATGAVVVLFALAGTGAAMLLGSVLHNAQQAGALGIFFALGLGALGGSMVPLEIFPPVMEKIAHLTPHAWALDALGEVIGRGGGIANVLPELGVLAAYGAVLLALATVLFRRTITT